MAVTLIMLYHIFYSLNPILYGTIYYNILLYIRMLSGDRGDTYTTHSMCILIYISRHTKSQGKIVNKA